MPINAASPSAQSEENIDIIGHIPAQIPSFASFRISNAAVSAFRAQEQPVPNRPAGQHTAVIGAPAAGTEHAEGILQSHALVSR